MGAAIGLAALPIFLPLDLRYGPSDRWLLVLSYAFYLALVLTALAASWLVRSQRRLLEMTFLLIVGTAVNANVFFYRAGVDLAVAANMLTVLMMGAAFLFPWTPRRTAVVCAVTGLPFLVLVASRVATDANQAHVAYGAGALVVGVMVAIAGSVVLASARDSLARAQAELSNLSARLMTSQEEERRRLSRELHDGVGQSITAVAAYLQSLEQQIPPTLPDLRSRATDARRLASRTLAEIRELSQLLRPSTLDDFGLLPSLTTYLREFQHRHGIAAHLVAEGLPERLPPDMETAVYRVVQEALTNVARHAHATHVRVTCRAADGALTVEVDDDGVGLTGRNGSGVGLIGIRERVLGLGGRVTLSSRGGVRLAVHLPLAR
jgi:signal transduction histidine kinase